MLWDFYRFQSVDPVLLATKREHYPALVQALLRVDSDLGSAESRPLNLISHEVLAAKRLHEFLLLELLLGSPTVTRDEIAQTFASAGIASGLTEIQSTLDTVSLVGYAQSDVTRYQAGIAAIDGDVVHLTDDFTTAYDGSAPLREAIADILRTGKQLTRDRYRSDRPFTPGMQYSRRDAARILGWSRATASTIYGVKTDEALGVCAIFVTLHKSDEVAASTAYQDRLLDPSTMQWFTKSNRTLESRDVRGIISGAVALHVFVKKDDADGTEHYYLGQATSHEARQSTMPDDKGRQLPVVTMLLKFSEPIKQGLFDYFHPLEDE